MSSTKLRVAAVGDIHVGIHSRGKYRHLFIDVSEAADILMICGDLTTRGLPEEIEVLIDDASHCKIPILAVYGNHDCESGHEKKLTALLEKANIRVLDGTTYDFRGVGFAGIKGFCGGFDNHLLSAWGEQAIKNFVLESVNEALKLEKALDSLSSDRRIVMMHYSPIKQTVVGEPPEIFPFLGCSRLEEPINRSRVSAVFHGHAHRGTLKGASAQKIPVFNVSLPVLTTADHPTPFFIYEV